MHEGSRRMRGHRLSGEAITTRATENCGVWMSLTQVDTTFCTHAHWQFELFDGSLDVQELCLKRHGVFWAEHMN